MRPYRGNGRPEAAYVIERMVDEAAAKSSASTRIELRRRNMIPPEAMPFKTGLTFTYDCGEFATTSIMALELADMAGFARAPRRGASARQAARHRPLQHDRARRRGRLRGGRDPLRPRRHGDAARRGSITQGRDTRRSTSRSCATGSASSPIRCITSRATPTRWRSARAPAARARRRWAARRCCWRPRRSSPRARRSPRTCSGVEADDVKFDDGVFAAPRTNRTLTIGEIAAEALQPAQPARRAWSPGSSPARPTRAKVENFPNGCHVCELEIDQETGIVEIMRYSVVDDVGTVMNPLLLEGQISGGIAQGIGQMLMEDIRFDPGSGQLLTGSFMDYAMPRASDSRRSRSTAIRCRPRPTRSASRARARPAASARCRRSATRWSTRCRRSASRRADAGDARAALARDPRSAPLSGAAQPARAARRRCFASEITGSKLKTRLALPPRMFRFACSERNGRS